MRADSLTTLHMPERNIGVVGGLVLAGLMHAMASLTECNVRGNNLDKESATLLAKVATEKRIMLFGIKHDQKEADFSGQRPPLGPVDAILIANDLAVSASVTECNLRSDSLGDKGAEAIATALKESTTSKLQKLDMYYNGIGPKGAAALASYMAVSASLTSVSLSSNRLCGVWYEGGSKTQGTYDATGINAIADSLRVNASLTSVDVGFNKIGKEAALELISIFKQKEMVFVGLGECNLGPEGAAAVAEYVRGSASLTTIMLSSNRLSNMFLGNRLGDEGVAAICNAVKENMQTKLATLDISCNGVGTAGAESVANMLLVNASLTKVCAAACSLICMRVSLSACLLLAQLNVKYNSLGTEGEAAIKEAVSGKEGFKLDL